MIQVKRVVFLLPWISFDSTVISVEPASTPKISYKVWSLSIFLS